MSRPGEPLTPAEMSLVAEGQPEVDAALRRFASRFTGIARDEQRSILQLALVEAARLYEPSPGRFGVYARFKLDFALLEARRQRHRHERLAVAVRAASRRFLAEIQEPELPFEGGDEEHRAAAVRLLEAHAATMLLQYAEEHLRAPIDEGLAEQVDAARARAVVAQIEPRLPVRQRAVLQRHYRDGAELSALAEELGVSRATITRDHAALLGTLRTSVLRANSASNARAE